MALNNRFGISLLSKGNYLSAYNEEVMIDKKTGEVLIRTESGDTISYNYNSRLNNQISTIKAIANNLSVYGDIISIELDTPIQTPCTLEFDTDYISNYINLPYKKCKKILFNVDIDPITIDYSGLSRDRNNISVELKFCFYYKDNTRTKEAVITSSLNDFNSTVFQLDDNSIIDIRANPNVAGIKLLSFKVLDNIMDYNGNSVTHNHEIRPILNNILAVIQA